MGIAGIKKKGNKNNFYITDEKNKPGRNYWIGGYAVVAASFLLLHFLMELSLFDFIGEYKPLAKK